MTTDPGAAETFYKNVVGWTSAAFEASPTPYTLTARKEDVAHPASEEPRLFRMPRVGIEERWEENGVLTTSQDIDQLAADTKKAGVILETEPHDTAWGMLKVIKYEGGPPSHHKNVDGRSPQGLPCSRC